MRTPSARRRPFLLLLLGACGAKTPLDLDDRGLGGSPPTAASTTGASTSAGAGGASAELTCPALAWAGPPVSVAFGGEARSPRLVRVAADRWAVVFRSADGGGGLVASFAIEDPFGAWPPALGPADAHFPTNEPFAATAGDPGQIAFVAADSALGYVLGQSPPGENGCTFVDWPGPAGEVVFTRRSPLGPYLVGRLDPLARGAGLGLSLVSSFMPNPQVTDFGVVGCSTGGIPADAIQISTGDWLVASAAQAALVACGEAEGEPRYLQVHRVSPAGTLDGTFATSDLGVVAELALAATQSGAWLAHRLQDDGALVIHPVTPEGAIDFAQPSHLVGPETHRARHAITGAKDTWAAAELVPNESIPGGSLTVHVSVDFALVGTVHDGAVIPSGVPSLVASEDGTSFLVAYEDASGFAPAIGLRRADCVLP